MSSCKLPESHIDGGSVKSAEGRQHEVRENEGNLETHVGAHT